MVLSDVWENGGNGGQDLARAVVDVAEQKSMLTFAYELEDSLVDKMTKVVQKVYGGEGIVLAPGVKKELTRLEALGFGNLPICMAKTQYSFSDDKNKLGRPEEFIVTIKKVKVSAGAGFIVVLTGDIMTMPGLPKIPAAESIDVLADGRIIGLF